jgi:ubiquinone/menaquinone biosynthesis C-methylase UbiE
MKLTKEIITKDYELTHLVPGDLLDADVSRLKKEIADLVYMITVHHELLEPEKLLKEGYRLLKPGGKITIIDWKKEEMIDGPSIEKRISEEMIIKQLKNAGFNNISQYNLLPLHSFIIAQK